MKSEFNLMAREWIDEPHRKCQYNVALFHVVAKHYDFVTKALSRGRDQSWKRQLITMLPAVSGPQCLDLACGTGDITFALREKYADGQIEGLQILAPGGTAAFLDFSKPRNRMIQRLQYQVLSWWGGFWGLVLHFNPEVYAYIAKSLATFPDRDTLRHMLAERGFINFRQQRFYFGTLELLVCDARL